MPSSTRGGRSSTAGAAPPGAGHDLVHRHPFPLAVVGSPSTTAAAEPSATFNFGTAAQPLGLDPALSSDVESQRITRQILEGLVGVDQTTGKPTPLLATEWTESNEGRTYTFKLRTVSPSTTARPSTPTPCAPTSTAGSRFPATCGGRLPAARSRASSRPTPTNRRCPSSKAARRWPGTPSGST